MRTRGFIVALVPSVASPEPPPAHCRGVVHLWRRSLAPPSGPQRHTARDLSALGGAVLNGQSQHTTNTNRHNQHRTTDQSGSQSHRSQHRRSCWPTAGTQQRHANTQRAPQAKPAVRVRSSLCGAKYRRPPKPSETVRTVEVRVPAVGRAVSGARGTPTATRGNVAERSENSNQQATDEGCKRL